MKPEGVVAFTTGDERRLLIVDDRGGYAVVDYPRVISRSRGWSREAPDEPWPCRPA